MFGWKKVQELLNKAFREGWTAPQLAKSAAIGFYVAFCPFPFLHTVVMIGLKFIFRLNFPILFIVASINNPWTMVPLYSLDYVFGYWLVHKVLGLTPLWSYSFQKVFGAGSVCVWSFLIGGNLIGLLAAILSYPILKSIFTHFSGYKRIPAINLLPGQLIDKPSLREPVLNAYAQNSEKIKENTGAL